MKFLIDECLHTSLVAVAEARGHEARHVTWLGLRGHMDWNLMRRIVDEDFTLVTNNARDFRRLYAREPIHAGLIIIVPQSAPEKQRELFDVVLERFVANEVLVNEVIEIELDEGIPVTKRYGQPP